MGISGSQVDFEGHGYPLGHGAQNMNTRIVINPGVQHGKPVIRGTRVPVVRIIGGLAGGMTVEEITKEYGVTEEDVRAALAYAGELIEQEEHHPLPAK
jgi:uncharacterized protein (DUF433 family)